MQILVQNMRLVKKDLSHVVLTAKITKAQRTRRNCFFLCGLCRFSAPSLVRFLVSVIWILNLEIVSDFVFWILFFLASPRICRSFFTFGYLEFGIF